MTARLPEEFADVEEFADRWCLATETERFDARMASTMPELRSFYDAFFPRVEQAIEYCDQFALDDLPPTALNLLHMIYSLINVAASVDMHGQIRPVGAGDAVLVRTREPRP